jgi:glutamine synthetase
LEFYLIDQARTAAGGPQPPISAVTGQRLNQTQVYSMSDLDEFGGLLAEIASACRVQNIPAYTAVAEYAPGQFEVNLKHRPDAVSACDDAVLLKRLIKAQSRKHGLDATFMAKPYPERSGSGTHIHVSLLDESGRNVFGGDEASDTSLGHALGGLLETMPESMALFVPNANSFRRFQPGSYAPMAPTWGHNNRTVALRIPAGPPAARRIEHRVAGADANPYLVVATVLAGIHYGLTNQCEPGPQITGNAEEQTESSLPLEWMAALEALDTGEIMMDYLGSDVCHVFLETRGAERHRFLQAITPLEHQWYLETV